MRPGIAGMLPEDLRRIDAAVLDDVRELGFHGVSVLLGEAGAVLDSDLARARRLIERADLTIAQANGLYPSLVSDEAEVRRAGVAEMSAHIRSARLLGARTCYLRPGGLNPAGPWWPHPDHHTRAVFERAVASVRELVSVAEDQGVTLALEGHAVSVLDRPERIGELLRSVDSPALTFNFDPVNFIGSLWDAWRPQQMFDRLLAAAGTRIVSAHWKDYAVQDRHVLHISEAPLGEGLVDHAGWLRRLEAAQPAAWVLIEHHLPRQIPAAKRVLDAAMETAGIQWDAA